MKEKITSVRPSDLASKRLRAPDGRMVTVKVVQSNSDTLEADFLAAFRSNVSRVRRERRQRNGHAAVASEG